MYNKLIIQNENKLPIEELDLRLRSLGFMGFNDLSKAEENLIKGSKTANEFIRIFFYLNSKHTSWRWSNRFQKLVASRGNARSNINTNRSTIDIFLTALNYAPQFADFRILYTALMTWLFKDYSFKRMICSTIHRNVWYYRGSNRLVEEVLGSNVKRRTTDLNQNEFGKYDELGTAIENERGSDQFKIIFNAEQTAQSISTKPAITNNIGSGTLSFIKT